MQKFTSDKEFTEKTVEGINALVDVVSSTLGPRGRNVVLHKKGHAPMVTKDGVTVSKFIQLEDPTSNAAIQILKQASEKTNSDAGDGTTSTAVLARAIYMHAQKHIAAGLSPIELKRGIDKAVAQVVERLADSSKQIRSKEDIINIATVASNGDREIAELIATAIDQAGKDGAITIEEARSLDTSLELVEGFQVESGYISNHLVTNERTMTTRYGKSLVFVTDETLSTVESFISVLEATAKRDLPLVIIAEEIKDQALAALIANHKRGSLKVAAIRAPRYGEERRNILRDLALSVGAQFVSSETGIFLKDAGLEHLGMVDSIEIKKNNSVFVGGHGKYEDIEKRIESLTSELKQTDDMNECERIQERITRLGSSIAIIRVGGATDVEMIEKKHRIEDALEAVKSAQDEGVVPGGGVALIRATQKMVIPDNLSHLDQATGFQIVSDAAKAPLLKMATNAGCSPDIILLKVLDSDPDFGYDFTDGEMKHFFEEGIVDPTKVVRCALQNASSVATTLLTTNHCVVEVE